MESQCPLCVKTQSVSMECKACKAAAYVPRRGLGRCAINGR